MQSAGAQSILEFQKYLTPVPVLYGRPFANIRSSLSSEGPADSTGYVAFDHTNQLIVISFRGTASFSNILADINLVMVPWNICPLCTAHAGFLDSWNSVKPQIQGVLATATTTYPSYKIVATGHSLGGAIATLATADLRKNSGYDVSLVCLVCSFTAFV